jgi:hypothetical protein
MAYHWKKQHPNLPDSENFRRGYARACYQARVWSEREQCLYQVRRILKNRSKGGFYIEKRHNYADRIRQNLDAVVAGYKKGKRIL